MSNDWTLPVEAFGFLHNHLPPMGVTIVELGSGDGTLQLRELGNVCSIEHDPAWLRSYPGANFIHAPIVDGWYDPAAIQGKLPAEYDCIVVDGPPGNIGRLGMLKHLDLFQRVPVLVDDVHRAAERDLAIELARTFKQNLSVHYLMSGRAFATMGWPL